MLVRVRLDEQPKLHEDILKATNASRSPRVQNISGSRTMIYLQDGAVTEFGKALDKPPVTSPDAVRIIDSTTTGTPSTTFVVCGKHEHVVADTKTPGAYMRLLHEYTQLLEAHGLMVEHSNSLEDSLEVLETLD